jgi:Na+/proline symporter
MTIFGAMLRGVMPDLTEPEAGLSTFFHERMGPIATGLIVADVFATISATSNSLLVAMSQALGRDVIPLLWRGIRLPEALGSIVLGALTMGASLVLPGSVKSIALSSVSLMSASVAPAVLIRIVGWRHDARSLTVAVIAGFACALAWRAAGLDDAFNESAPGIAGALLAHFLVVRLSSPAPVSSNAPAE